MSTFESIVTLPRSHWLAPLLVGLLFGVFAVQFSVYQGSLSAPVAPDDIAYFAESAEALQDLYAQGPARFLRKLVSAPPHSPFAFANSLAAFAIFGVHDWATAAFNVLWVVVLLYGIRQFLHDLSTFEYVAVSMCVLAWPLPGFLVMEGRPDVVFGLVLAALVYFLVLGQSPLTQPRSRWAAGVLLGGVLLIKPSALPLTVAVVGSALVVAVLKVRNDNPDWPRSALKSATQLLGAAAVVAGTYYLFAGKDIFNYIYATTFGAEREIWSLNLSTAGHLLFYLAGQGGKALYSWWLPITVALGCVVAVLEFREKGSFSRDVLWAAPCVLLALTILTVPGHKSVFFGFTLAAFALFTFLIFARFLFRAASGSIATTELTKRRAGGTKVRFVLALMFVGMALLTFKVPWSHRSGGGAELESASVSKQRYMALAGVVDAMRPDSGEAIRVFFPAFTPYLNQATVRFELAKRRLHNVVVSDGSREGKIDDVLPEIAAATHVVLPDDAASESPAYLPSTALIPKLRAHLEADPAFRKVARIPGVGVDAFDIFERERARPFGDVEFVMGVLATEGPYPQWNLPIVKWAVGPTAALRLNRDRGELRILTLTMQSHLPQQRVTAQSGTTLLGSCDIPVPGKVVQCEIPLRDMHPDAMITLAFAHADQDTPRRAVLFHSIHAR